MEKFKNIPFVQKMGFNRIVLVGVFIILYIMFAILSPTFLNYQRILSALNYAYFLGFLAMGVTFVIATGGIDFSMGPVMFACALISGQTFYSRGIPMAAALALSILIGMVFGLFNGFLVSYVGLPSFITSLANMMIAKGLGSVYTSTQTVRWPQSTDPNGWYRSLLRINVGGTIFPIGLVILILAAIICAMILNMTRPGRYILCLGSNKEAVRLSGVDVKKWELLAYVLCGLLSGIAAIFFVGAYTTVQPGMGDTFNNEAIASCVMGGTSMAGGVASIGGSIIGTMIISLVQEGILAMGFQKDMQYIITGVIVLVAVYADIRSKKKKN